PNAWVVASKASSNPLRVTPSPACPMLSTLTPSFPSVTVGPRTPASLVPRMPRCKHDHRMGERVTPGRRGNPGPSRIALQSGWRIGAIVAKVLPGVACCHKFAGAYSGGWGTRGNDVQAFRPRIAGHRRRDRPVFFRTTRRPCVAPAGGPVDRGIVREHGQVQPRHEP